MANKVAKKGFTISHVMVVHDVFTWWFMILLHVMVVHVLVHGGS